MRYLAALLDLLLAGCHLLDPGSSPHADAPFVIRTEDDAYTIERIEEELRLAVPMALTNRTGQPVYINKCGVPHPSLQKQVDGEWVTVYSPVVLMCLEAPLVIDDGETYDYVFQMLASLRPDTFPAFEADEIPGQYRFKWGLNTRYEPGNPAEDPLPEALRVSNTFRVTEK